MPLAEERSEHVVHAGTPWPQSVALDPSRSDQRPVVVPVGHAPYRFFELPGGPAHASNAGRANQAEYQLGPLAKAFSHVHNANIYA